MQKIRFIPIPTKHARALTQGGADAYGNAAERSQTDGSGNPCRHCLSFIAKGAGMLTLAYRPFQTLHPYAETGPIFLCEDQCPAWQGQGLPPILTSSPDYLLKGYTADERICYGTGRVTPRDEIETYAASLMERRDIAFVDVRSARNNCFQVRITRA